MDSSDAYHCSGSTTKENHPLETCIGCGSITEAIEGPVHEYMLSSPGCFAAFNSLLAAEYSSEALQSVNRLTVDAFAVQHPGMADDRRAVQSVGLHLARLSVQLESPRPPSETNAVMLDFAEHKATLVRLEPPKRFSITAPDVAPFAATPSHPAEVRQWATETWRDWTEHHEYIRSWIRENSRYGS